MYDSICNTYEITSTLYDFTPLKLSHYIHCTQSITHPIYDITHMAIRTLYLPSVPLYLTLNPLYLCHQTQGISYTTPILCMTSHTIRVTSYSVCFLSQLFRTLHTSMNYFTPSILLTRIQYARYHHTTFMKTQRLYGTSHPPYLTSQPLYLCHHTDGTHRCIDVSLY